MFSGIRSAKRGAINALRGEGLSIVVWGAFFSLLPCFVLFRRRVIVLPRNFRSRGLHLLFSPSLS